MALLKFTAVLSAFCCFLPWGNAAGLFGGGSLGNPLKMTVSDLKNCTPGDALVLKKLSLPDTIHIPGPVPVSLTGELKEPLSGPLSIAVELKKKVLGTLLEVPCINNLGSCVYDNICEKLDQIFPGDSCPSEILSMGGSCHCPIQPSVLHFPPTTLNIPEIIIAQLPPFLTAGEFHLQVTANSGKKTIGCLHTSVTLA
ncbi:ganglioside GM2 activator-like [Amia ocellicauda]|uniref:ganglioside GM2 activator-like n=1 Tax=Amia ocellicauda TaxID=2972642 RepID=UPI003463CDCF